MSGADIYYSIFLPSLGLDTNEYSINVEEQGDLVSSLKTLTPYTRAGNTTSVCRKESKVSVIQLELLR
ncbi:hypothetical protein CEXT_122311 [Caerostris extrusa]|uniref:Uncharacterized protein n=1 Tax=Caerostris extrusa TaxID=172846 RepID=A0AAV4XXN6_CAEEX|nr:hypothetical protein CEXT_122311 [Caerostris extrusa]